MSSSLAVKRSEDEEICQDASKFVTLYNSLADDKHEKRNKIGLLYDAVDATLLWNGNSISGIQQITGFWNALPQTTHEPSYIDAHSIYHNSASKNLVVQVMGTVLIGGISQISRAYNQVFILASVDGHYRIKSDSFRFME